MRCALPEVPLIRHGFAAPPSPQGGEGKRKSPGGGLGIDFFPYHVILKIKRGAAGRREPLASYKEVTVKRLN